MKYTRLLLQRIYDVPRQRLCYRIMFLLICLTMICYICIISNPDDTKYYDSTILEYIDNVTQDHRYASFYWKPDTLPKNLKFILLWTPWSSKYHDLGHLGEAQDSFIKNNCSVVDCYVTADRHFFGSDLSRFDAIAFNGRNITTADLPATRHPHQKYIFLFMESSENYPVCEEEFDGFFNWTSTYKLKSDIPYTYFSIRNAAGEVVGPKVNMHWDKVEFSNVKEEEFIYNLWKQKRKAAAWFVSNCGPTRSGREHFVKQLQGALQKYGWTIDIYGRCGTLQCPRPFFSECASLMRNNYFFYMALENSFDEDYVTEKVLTALLYDVIPVVYGGANYSRFLPPSSFLNGRDYTPEALARTMDHYIKSGREYVQFFKWHSHYTFHGFSFGTLEVENVCALCAALNDRTKIEAVTVYDHFREWWYPEYETEPCIPVANIEIMNSWRIEDNRYGMNG